MSPSSSEEAVVVVWCYMNTCLGHQRNWQSNVTDWAEAVTLSLNYHTVTQYRTSFSASTAWRWSCLSIIFLSLLPLPLEHTILLSFSLPPGCLISVNGLERPQEFFSMRLFSQSFLYEWDFFDLFSTPVLNRICFCSDPWSIVSLAFFLRYPNPYASHVISCDVISRTPTPSGSLLTTRLILKRGALPKWAPKGIMSRAESWVIEESEVDPYGKVVRCRTKNLDHVKVMQVHETVELREVADG